jgi:hypothetical protein
MTLKRRIAISSTERKSIQTIGVSLGLEAWIFISAMLETWNHQTLTLLQPLSLRAQQAKLKAQAFNRWCLLRVTSLDSHQHASLARIRSDSFGFARLRSDSLGLARIRLDSL